MSGQHLQLKDREVIDSSGERIGKVSDVLFDEATDHEPAWLVVKPGLFRAEHFVPASGAVAVDDESVRIAFRAEQVRSSPKAPSDHVVPSAGKAVLRDHYGLDH